MLCLRVSDDDFPLAIPARKQKEQELDNLSRFPVIAHGDPVMKRALERMAAMKNVGGLPSIPDLGRIGQPPFGGRGLPQITAVLSAIVIMQILRGMRSTGPGTSSRVVGRAETRSARELSKVSKVGGFGRNPGRTMGRGGIHVNAAADLRRVLFLSASGPESPTGNRRPAGRLPHGPAPF